RTAHAQAAATEAAAVDQFFVAFEAHFRGEAAALRAQLAQDYLPLLHAARAVAGDLPCLDLGCGRGVWLELLQAEGFKNQGVDLNPGPVALAQAQGLKAEVGDALAWLHAQPADSALAITAFHLMEHLPFALRLALTQECARVLAPGGVLVYETPNPENIWVGTHTFYHDPTHTQPLTPDSLAFLVEYCGLQAAPVVRLHPYPESANVPGDAPVVQRLNHMTCGGQDFAVIAHKPAAGAAPLAALAALR
ncbi:MAG: class I SAM-dependent methyltransferase, partial [Burkholderiaceae bacterium]|nr:class I SAM-dependent methyltransferase [Burkholderiaceae bacterium]